MRGVFAVMLLLALSIRAAVPAGYMPVQTSMGLVVSLCSGEAGKQIVIDIPMSDQQGEHEKQQDGPNATCAFASLAAPGIESAGVPGVSAPTQLLAEIALPPPAEVALPSWSLGLPPSQGPPSVV